MVDFLGRYTSLMDPMGLCFYLSIFLDLFCWWFFTDCTMINHHLLKPPFGRYFFWNFFPSIEPTNPRWSYFLDWTWKGSMLRKMLENCGSAVGKGFFEAWHRGLYWRCSTSQLKEYMEPRDHRTRRPIWPLEHLKDPANKLHGPSSALLLYESVIFPSPCWFFLRGAKDYGDKKIVFF